MRKQTQEDYQEVIEKIIQDPVSYDSWSRSADEEESFEIKDLISNIAWDGHED